LRAREAADRQGDISDYPPKHGPLGGEKRQAPNMWSKCFGRTLGLFLRYSESAGK
jgi:hypothetical protein